MTPEQQYLDYRVKKFFQSVRTKSLIVGIVISLIVAWDSAFPFFVGSMPVLTLLVIVASTVAFVIVGFWVNGAMIAHDSFDFIARLNAEAEAAKRISNKD